MSESDRRRIVSSRHLAEGSVWETSEFEFGLIIAYNAFSRWMQKCMAAAGLPELGSLEILILHHINHRDRDKRVADIGFLLNIEDSHTISYALKKLLKLEVVSAEKRGKEVFYSTSAAGKKLCEQYKVVREECLLSGIPETGITGPELARIATVLRTMSGQYDQASRAASTL